MHPSLNVNGSESGVNIQKISSEAVRAARLLNELLELTLPSMHSKRRRVARSGGATLANSAPRTAGTPSASAGATGQRLRAHALCSVSFEPCPADYSMLKLVKLPANGYVHCSALAA